ncbi:MAG: TIGR03915 family putative DNA repair protein [Lachnospiraceae bacterium]|nr:TIGR03915 family putative DNA repair protein [Lachnospiraceae bacterium]
MTIFSCDDNLTAMMTCIYDAWASKKGHDNVRLLIEPICNPELFVEYVHVEPDPAKEESVIRSIRNKISELAYEWVYYAATSSEEDKLDIIYRFLILGFKLGKDITKALSYPQVLKMAEIQKKSANEAYSFIEFIRFNSINNEVYLAHIEPKSNVIHRVASHFSDRMPMEHWMIVDDKRKLAAIHPKNTDFFIKYLTEDEFLELSKFKESSDYFVVLWKEYFATIAIKERENRQCQLNHLPLWKRKNLTEFN